MVIELVSGSNGPFSNPDWDHCVVVLGTGYFTLKVPLSVNCILGDVARLTKFHLSDHGRKLGELSDLICFRYLAFRCTGVFSCFPLHSQNKKHERRPRYIMREEENIKNLRAGIKILVYVSSDY